MASRKMTVGELRRILKWVIKYLEMIRDGLCQDGKGAFAVTLKNDGIHYDIDCPPPDDTAPPTDLCRLLDEIIKALKKVMAQFPARFPDCPVRE
jgi:hypothetical protein